VPPGRFAERRALDDQFQAAIRAALAEEKARWPQSQRALELVVDTIGIRPAGQQPDSMPIVQAALRTREAIVAGKEVIVPGGTNPSSSRRAPATSSG
jgi:hypothetical protein